MRSLSSDTQQLCARGAGLTVGTKRKWEAVTRSQDAYVEAYSRLKGDEKVMKLKGTATREASGVVLESLIKETLRWYKKGIACKIGGKAGVQLDSGFTVYSPTVASVRTKSDDTAWFIRGAVSGKGPALHDKILSKIEEAKENGNQGYDLMRFPKVKIDKLFKATELKGLALTSDDLRCFEASQEVTFEMDESGAKVIVKTKIQMKGTGHNKPTVVKKKIFSVDGSFAVAIWRKGCKEPYFVATFKE